MGNVLYDRLLPFLNRRPLEASVARSAALPVTKISIPRNQTTRATYGVPGWQCVCVVLPSEQWMILVLG